MRHLFIAIILFTANIAAAAVLNKPVICMDTKELVVQLTERFGEHAIWFGRNDATDVTIAFFTNKDTGTWTLVEFDESAACVLGSGRSSEGEFRI